MEEQGQKPGGTVGASPPGPDPADAGASGVSSIVQQATDLFDAFIAYVRDVVQLEGLRVESGIRSVIARAAVVAGALAFALSGAVFLFVALAQWLSSLIGSSAAGFALAGLVQILIATAALMLWRRGTAGD